MVSTTFHWHWVNSSVALVIVLSINTVLSLDHYLKLWPHKHYDAWKKRNPRQTQEDYTGHLYQAKLDYLGEGPLRWWNCSQSLSALPKTYKEKVSTFHKARVPFFLL
jgi:hypothetical protein